MKCKECKGKMVPDLRIDVLGYHYFWKCEGCGREVKLDKVVERRILWPQLPPKVKVKKHANQTNLFGG